MKSQQIIDLGGDQFNWPGRTIPARHVRHFVDGFNGREFAGQHKYGTAVDIVTGEQQQVEIETDALMYYARGRSLRYHVDKGHKTTVSGDWLRANYELVVRGEGDYRIYAKRRAA